MAKRQLRDQPSYRRSDEQRQARSRDWWENESEEQRQVRLEHSRDQLAAESPEQRQARVQRMSDNQRERQATETPEGRQAKLQRMSGNQRERLATESVSERLQLPSGRETGASREQPFKQRSVQMKMR